MRTRNLITTFLFSTIAILSAGCQNEPSARTELAPGSAEVNIRGTVQGLSSASTSRKVALVWTYWNQEDCETWVDAAGNPGSGCSGSSLATTATLETGTNGFVLTQAEPPPAFVHGYQTEVAEAVIALLPEGDLTEYDVRGGVPEMAGVSRDHLVVYVPEDLPAERYEAQALGGAALGKGFHLVRSLDDAPQIEGTGGPLACTPGSTCTVYTIQSGELAAPGEQIVIQVGDADAPAMFL